MSYLFLKLSAKLHQIFVIINRKYLVFFHNICFHIEILLNNHLIVHNSYKIIHKLCKTPVSSPEVSLPKDPALTAQPSLGIGAVIISLGIFFS
ncbi:hypothetical protein EEL33_18330 [Muribaculaceae bacterium Isolate-037 (Harlan)]|nr:hypothetical protein EEL33_18330 [Muribaculaceae bacterium Isolate-037 (Harlan)]